LLWGVQKRRSTSPELSFSGRSDRGCVRETNEDYIQVFRKHGLFFLADGIGGQRGGEVASRLAARSVEQYFDLAYEDGLLEYLRSGRQVRSPAADLKAALMSAHSDIVEERAMDPALKNMGTTAVCLLVVRGRAIVAHVGDSRCYLLRDGRLRQLTRDHSLANEVDQLDTLAPGMTAEMALRSNIVVRSLGAATTDRASGDIVEIPVRREDRFLLCSDGLTNELAEEQLGRQLLSAPTAKAAVGGLVDGAIRAGGRDNVSAIVVVVR